MDYQPTYRKYTCEEIMNLVGAYSIGATTPEETQAVEVMLPECPEAAAELAEYMAMGDAMLHMLPMDKEPPPDLMGQLNLPEAKPTSHTPEPAPLRHTAARHTEPKPQIIQLPAPTERSTPWLGILGFAAMFAVMVGMNIVWYTMFKQTQAQQTQLTTLITQQQELISSLERQSQQPPLVMAGGSTHHMELQPNTDNANGATARVIWDANSLIGTLYVAGLPQTDEAHNYQMWLVQGDNEISLGSFSVTEEGVGTLVFQSPAPIGAADVIGISTEPVTGSPEPTTPHLVTGKIET